ncbi:MAG: ABC transporter permease [Candidatus Thorarchaeota archaeon]|nr:ABC transporter permease [Candidatus Thorarchaeota archaeon]
MRATDTLAYAFGAIRLRKVRSGLTTLGIVIGIAAIVALLSFTQGFQVAIEKQFQQGFSTDTVIVSTGYLGFGSSSDFSLYVNDTDYINTLDNVQYSAAVLSKSCTATFEDMSRTVSVHGVNFTTYGNLYSTFVAEHGVIPAVPSDDAAVIGHGIYDPFDNGSIAVDVGQTFLLQYATRNGTSLVYINKTVTVVAVLAEIGGFGVGPSDNGVYIPLQAAVGYFNTEVVNQIVVRLMDHSDAMVKATSDAIKALYSNKVSVTSPTALLATISSALGLVSLLMAGIAGISLLVAGVGIMNIMIVSLIERTREIGILKALGAKGRTVLAMFLAEAGIIGLIGAVVGIVVGAVLGNVIAVGVSGITGGNSSGFGAGGMSGRLGMAFAPIVTPSLIMVALFFGVSVSLVFALYPAHRASKLMPVDALRSE